MTAARRLLPLLGLALLLPSPAPAEETPAPAVDAAAAAGEAATAEGQGRYADAAKAWRRAADAGGAGAADAWAGLARVLEATGRIPEALDAARKAAELAPKAIDSLVLLGRIQAASGDPEGAVKVLAEAAASAANRALPSKALGDVLRATGRRKEALERYAAANAAWASGATDDPADLVAVVEARFSIMELDPNPGYREQFQSTLDILAVPLKAGLPAAIVAEAEFYARHDQTERVPKALRPLLTRNPNHPDALVVAARAKERRFESDEAAALARRALAVDPTHPGAVEVLALLRYGDGAREEAVATVRRALAARPRDRALLALDAIPAYLDGDMEAFEKGLAKSLAVDPAYGRAYRLVARVLEDQRRFAEAVALSRRAVEVDPLDADAWFSLGRNLLNLGEEKEAKAALDRAEKADPWRNIFRNNFRGVLEELDTYSTGSTAHFQIQIHAAEDGALRPLYEKALERSLADLKKRYAFDPAGPILVEVFRRAEDFSARTLGVPGFGAVGACFGRVVTLDSPSALPTGAFSWRSTAHHELAHVFHLQMTRGRVPRWFTEGLATHEEAVYRPHWVRNMDRDLVSALANGEVKGLLEIDGTFRGPGILWAYYQGGLMLGWIEREFGWPKVLEMIRLYGEDRGNAETVKRALGLSPEEFDGRFLARCRALTEAWKVRPAWSDGRLAEFRARSGKDPKDLAAHLDYAEACLQRGNTIDAGTALARARALAPDDPRLAELKGTLALRTLRTPDRGLELYREALAGGWDHYDLRMALGLAADRAGKAEEAVEHFRRAKLLFPRSAGPGGPRQALARILTGLGRPDDALRELEEVAALSETDVESRLALAGAYEDRGDAAAAARVLAEILDVLPVPPRGERNAFPAAEVHARHARALDGTGRPGEAADSFRLAVVVGRTFDPKAAPAAVAGWLVELARAARAAGRTFEARAALQDALRTDPGNAEAAELLRAMEGS